MFFKKIIRQLYNVKGWHTDRKFVIIESDDWGSIRMPSKQIYEKLLCKGFPVDKDPYSRFDSLESNQDLESLFEILRKHSDSNGNCPVITANTIMANPDFEKIRINGFSTYFYEPFTGTLERYASHDRVLSLYHEGIKEGIFHPQLHGREHLNIAQWMSALKSIEGLPLRQIFDYEAFGINVKGLKSKRNNLMAALDYEYKKDLDLILQSMKEANDLFFKIFNYHSKTFIAPCYVWDHNIENCLNNLGVIALQGIPYQYIPKVNSVSYGKALHYTGQKNKLGQTYLVRNVFFEPSLDPKIDWVSESLMRIEEAFKGKKPAIIGSHRLNYIGYMDTNNRNINLKLFDNLLSNIIMKWPSVEFITSDQLIGIMKS